MITGILGFLGTVSGLARKADDSKTVQKLLDGVDHLKLSDEEKIKYVIEQKKIMEAGENSIRSVTRRILAVGIVGTAFGFLWLAAIFWCISKEYTEFLLGLLDLPIVKNSVLAVVIFYFGYYGITKIVDRIRGGKNADAN